MRARFSHAESRGQLLGRMMRDSGQFDEQFVEAIRRIRAAGRWRLIALTNNFTKNEADLVGGAPPTREQYPDFSVASELAFLGWQDGIAPPRLRALFDDFCDSSTLGKRKPEPEIYRLACERNGIRPDEAVFLDDLGLNLKAAQALGMETIRVQIGDSLGALRVLEGKLGVDLTGDVEPAQRAPSRL